MKIYAALLDDIADGHVWIKRDGFPIRTLIKVKNTANGKVVYCEALQIDKYFLNSYNKSPRIKIDDPKSVIVMSEWYRSKLGNLETQKDYPLEINVTSNIISKLLSTFQHPQIIVRVAVILGGISVFIALIGLILTIISIWC